MKHLREKVGDVDNALRAEMKRWNVSPSHYQKLTKISEPLRFGDEEYEEARKKADECQNLVKRMKLEKRAREARMEHLQAKNEQKLNEELNKRKREQEAKEKA